MIYPEQNDVSTKKTCEFSWVCLKNVVGNNFFVLWGYDS